MRKFFIVIFIITFFMSNVFASVFDNEQKLAYIVNQIPALRDISCKFTQEKMITSSNIILKSGGDFTFKNNVVTFYTTYPIRTTTLYSSKDYRYIGAIINAISSKSYKSIENEYNFYFQKTGKVWNLGLKPKKNSKSYNYIKTIEIIGENDISCIIITTSDLTRTTIRFFK